MIAKILLVIGILGILLGILVTGISVVLPVVTDGRTSWEEAMFGIIPGILVLLISFLIAIGGLIGIVMARKKKQ